MADFKYEIVEHIGTLSESAKGWTKELNRISWNGGEPKYDIRDWAPEHEKMGKGVTLSEDEMMKFAALEYDILLSTSIVESGIHLPNVNTIVIGFNGRSIYHQSPPVQNQTKTNKQKKPYILIHYLKDTSTF